MGSKIEYVDSSQMYATNYVRNAKAVGVLWGIFTVCYAIIVAVAFITPEWIGDTSTSENPARFGLWSSCYFGNGVSTAVEDCQGKLEDLTNIPSVAIRVAAIFGGVSVCIAIIIVVMLLLFFFFQSTTVYLICGWLHILSGKWFFLTIFSDLIVIICIVLTQYLMFSRLSDRVHCCFSYGLGFATYSEDVWSRG